MTSPFKKTWQKSTTTLLLLALLGASLHIFTHLRDHIETHSSNVIGHRDESHSSGKSSFNSFHACAGCESLDHHQSDSPITASLPTFESMPDSSYQRSATVPPIYSRNLSDRAPPLL